MSELQEAAHEQAINHLISVAESQLDQWRIQSRLTQDPDTLSALSEDIFKTESAIQILRGK